MLKKNSLEIQALSPGPEPKPKANCIPSCQPPIDNPVPELPQLQAIQTINTSIQGTPLTLDDVNLGTLTFSTGTAFSYQVPNTIQVLTPGLYKVEYSAGVLLNSETDYLLLAPFYNLQFLTSAVLVFSNQDGPATQLLSKSRSFYLANNSTTTLQFYYVSTSVNNLFDDFTVTIIKVQ